MNRALVIVLDSLGVGASPDADKFGDAGANTLLHIAQACAEGHCEQGRSGALHLPNLQSMGIHKACELVSQQTLPLRDSIEPHQAAFGCAASISTAKDTTSGHWEMMGVPVLFDWGYFRQPQDSFPVTLINQLIAKAQLPGILGNCIASGTEVIQRFGQQHMQTAKPICYTSADSVFQIAYHEAVISTERAESICQVARNLLDDYNIARVIRRPFTGANKDEFVRTANRKDYSMQPPNNTLLDHLLEHSGRVISVGKISDIFAHQGISQAIKADGLDSLMDATLDAWKSCQDNELVFTNIVDFDSLYGHRRDVNGYALALEQFDRRLSELLQQVSTTDLLILTADHGCDPTFPGTDHTREYIPVLATGKLNNGCVGVRDTFADVAQSLAAYFGLSPMAYGQSFINETN
ncbi:MAG: phosphopentomutase [Aestuariibacter sp.]